LEDTETTYRYEEKAGKREDRGNVEYSFKQDIEYSPSKTSSQP